MKILIYTAIHKREEITKLFLLGIERLKQYSGHKIYLFCVCSEKADSLLLNKNNIHHVIFPNKPLSDKFEYGFKKALELDFDYMLRLGSDDLLDHEIFDKYYNKLMQSKVPYFGLKTIGIVEHETLDSLVYSYKIGQKDYILGGGSMLSRELCMKFKDEPLFNRRKINRGLDRASEIEILRHTKSVSVSTASPMLIDIKTKENIWGFQYVKKYSKKAHFGELTHFTSKQEDRLLRIINETYSIIAIIPVKGRLPLLRHTITRLINKNKVKVICVGDEYEKEFCEKLGAEYVVHENKPLGKKWNAGFMAAKKHKPDACLFVGSSDWISDNWVDVSVQYLKDYDMIGKPDFYLLDYGTQLRLCHWAGYTDIRRRGEPIGIGRLLSARVLEYMNWKPLDDKLDSSLDYSMWQKVLNTGGRVKLITGDEIKSLSLSTNSWINKHKFEEHWSGKLHSEKMKHDEFLKQYFPESYLL